MATSTAAAEFVALSELCSEIIWYKQLVKDLKVETRGAIKVLEDNTTCIQMALTERVKNRSKHVDIMYHKREIN